ncbi:MAG: hypothetical protein KGL75_08985, partial [Acidobacteriota bacterium]|nr:hypothetical protein [Acidobacteriota bacterium]
ACGNDLAEACRTAYDAANKIKIDGAFYRRDIARRAIEAGESGARAGTEKSVAGAPKS